jgi:hypothetical protein
LKKHGVSFEEATTILRDPTKDNFTKRAEIVPRGAYNDGGRPTGAAREGEASNDLPLLSTQVTWW